MAADRPGILGRLSEEDARRVLQVARRRAFRRNEPLFHEGDPANAVHIIQKGRVATRITTIYGETATLQFCGPGDIVGELALVSSGERLATVVALEPTETLALHRDEFDRLRQKHVSVNEFLVELLAEKLKDASKRVVEAMYVKAPDRVRRRVLDLARLYGDSAGRARIPATQEDIAGLAGTTRPTVNQVLRREEQRGTIRLGRGWIEVLDRESLASRSG